MTSWAQNDPVGSRKFLAGLPEGNARNSAVQSYVSQLSWQSPEFAAPYINQIADENQRFNSAQYLALNYKGNDSAGYAKWLTTLNLPEEKLKLLPK